MKNRSDNKKIYSINVSDVQGVAEENFGRRLTKEELKIVEDKIGDYFNWYDSIDFLISDQLKLKRIESE